MPEIGEQWLPHEHPRTEQPIGRIRDHRDPSPAARVNSLGHPYCMSCDTRLAPNRGTQKALCPSHDRLRANYRQQQSLANKPNNNFQVTLGRAQSRELLNSLDRLARAITVANFHFDPDADTNEWQHELLLAAKQVFVIADEHIRKPHVDLMAKQRINRPEPN